jgi:hypothetical protein
VDIVAISADGERDKAVDIVAVSHTERDKAVDIVAVSADGER